MIEKSGIIQHHAIYVKVTVMVPVTRPQYASIYGALSTPDEEDDDLETSFTCTLLRVPCKGEQLTLTVLPGNDGTRRTMHDGNYLRITGFVELVEHQGHVNPDVDILGTTFVYLAEERLELTFPKDWVPLS